MHRTTQDSNRIMIPTFRSVRVLDWTFTPLNAEAPEATSPRPVRTMR